jgi:hypothetical protein
MTEYLAYEVEGWLRYPSMKQLFMRSVCHTITDTFSPTPGLRLAEPLSVNKIFTSCTHKVLLLAWLYFD